jgi:hypothetical protein
MAKAECKVMIDEETGDVTAEAYDSKGVRTAVVTLAKAKPKKSGPKGEEAEEAGADTDKN